MTNTPSAVQPQVFPLADLQADLSRDEGGFSLAPYKDSLGFWTIAGGHYIGTDADLAKWIIAHPPHGTITKAYAALLFGQDIQGTLQELDAKLPWWRSLSPVRQRVLANWGFNMGVARLIKAFPFSLGLIADEKYALAAKQLERSLWHRQVGGRARRLEWMLAHDNTDWPDTKDYR